MTLPKTLWMVQYNLAGLQSPYKMSFFDHKYNQDKFSSYYDKSKDIGGDPIPNNTKKWPVVFATNDRVAYYFDNKTEAEALFKALNSYRDHIVRHM